MKERFETFTILINRIGRNIRKIKNQEMAEYHLKSAHISCLYYLYTVQGLTATELCERCEEDKATISRSIDYLAKNGYLTCDSKTTKKYKSPIILSEMGEEVGKKIADKIDNVLCEIGTELSDDERATFYRCLTIISKDLDSASKKYEQ